MNKLYFNFAGKNLSFYVSLEDLSLVTLNRSFWKTRWIENSGEFALCIPSFFRHEFSHVRRSKAIIAQTKSLITIIRPCHTAAILCRETKRALFYHAKPRSGNHGGEARRGETKLFWSPGTVWLPCDKGELGSLSKTTTTATRTT